MTWVLGSIVVCLGAVLVLCMINRYWPPDYDALEVRAANVDLPVAAGIELEVVTWNVGYAALGQEADFKLDGGKSLRALSRNTINEAATKLAADLAIKPADVICLQEVAKSSYLTRGVDILQIFDHALLRRTRLFWADMITHWVPPPWRFRHGMATYTSCDLADAYIMAIPGAEALFGGVIRKCYVGVLSHIPIVETDKNWIVINLHLPIFNTSTAAQVAYLEAIFSTAQTYYDNGHFVILAGDWNMRLADMEFPHTDDPSKVEWVNDLPAGVLPSDWSVVADTSVPSVRALHSPYRHGSTFTTVIDGFVVSPNVKVATCAALNLGFRHSDHNPVRGRFRALL